MARYLLPLDATEAAFSQQFDLGPARYTLQFTWNTRGAFWTLDLLTMAGEPILMGLRLVADWPMFRQHQDPRLPPGILFPVDMTGQATDPGRDDLGTRVQLYYDDLLDD